MSLDATNFPIRATEEDTYDAIIGAGVIGSPTFFWFHLVSDDWAGKKPWKEGWFVVLRERETYEDEIPGEPVGPEYRIDHQKIYETALKLAEQDGELDVRARYLRLLIDPEGVYLDPEDVDYLLQMATWGKYLYS